MILLIRIIDILCRVLVYMLLGRAILSWFVNPYRTNPQSFLFKLNALIVSVTEPIVMPFRKLMSRFNTGAFDFSIFVAMLTILIIQRILINLLLGIL